MAARNAHEQANTLVPARSLGARDIITVPVEDCVIVEILPVPGVLANRKNKLLKMKVIPLSGPWAGCEGVITVESSDKFVLVEKYNDHVPIMTRICNAFATVASFIKRMRNGQKEPKQLAGPVDTGPMT